MNWIRKLYSAFSTTKCLIKRRISSLTDGIFSSPSAERTPLTLIHPIHNSSMTATTTQLEQTTVLLDSLHESYQAIFEEAKTQLENIDIPNSAVERIITALSTHAGFLSKLRRTTVEELTEEIRTNTLEGTDADRLVQHLAVQVGNKLGDALQIQLDAKLKEYLESGVVEAAIEAKIGENTELASAVQTKATLKQAFALAFNLEMDDEIKAQAAAKEPPF